MKKFEFVFLVHLMNLIFNETAVLHESLQAKEINLQAALDLAQSTVENLTNMRDSDEIYDHLL